MKRILTAALASVLLPSAALAVDTGTVSGAGTIDYLCDMTLPSEIALSPQGADSLTGNSEIGLSQNGNTTYTLSGLTLTAPNGTDLLGTILLADTEGGTIVTQSSTTTPATGNKAGLMSGNGTVAITIQEITQPAMRVGNYSVSSTLSCIQQ